MTLPHPVLPCFTENLGEQALVRASLTSEADVRVLAGKWVWTEQQPWPPVEAVLQSPLWSKPEYSALRAELKRELLQPVVHRGGTFTTVSSRGQPAEGEEAAGEASQGAHPLRCLGKGGGVG